MQPSPRAETSRLLFPSLRFFIVPPRQGNSLPQFPAERELHRSDWRKIPISLIEPATGVLSVNAVSLLSCLSPFRCLQTQFSSEQISASLPVIQLQATTGIPRPAS